MMPIMDRPIGIPSPSPSAMPTERRVVSDAEKVKRNNIGREGSRTRQGWDSRTPDAISLILLGRYTRDVEGK